MRRRIALALVAAAVTVLTFWGPAGAQTTTTSSTTTTTVDPAVVASRAASALSLPSPRIMMNPDATRDQLANLPTWLWVEPRDQQRSTRTEGPTTVDVTASIVSVRFDTGDGEALTCSGGGTPYDPSRPESSQRSTCTHTWRRSSATAPGGTYRLTATVTWGLGWSGGSLGTRQSTASMDVRVAEAQSLDRPPQPLPGQTITGGSPADGSGPTGKPSGPGTNPQAPGGKPPKPPKPPKDPPWWRRAANDVGGFVRDVGVGGWDIVKGLPATAEMLGRLSPGNALANPKDYFAANKELADGLKYLAQHPGDLIRWDDIRNGHPGRAVADIALWAIPVAKGVGALKELRAARLGAEEARLAEEAAAAARATRAVDAARAEDAAAAAESGQGADGTAIARYHPVTGVGITEDGFPVFDSQFDAKIPESLRGPTISDEAQMRAATRELRDHLSANPAERALYTDDQLRAIKSGEPRIPGYTWHHNEDGSTLQLVDRQTHQLTGHSGGRAATGGRPR